MPTESAIKTQIQDLVKILDDERAAAVTDYIPNEATFISNLDSDYASDALLALQSMRSAKDNILNNAGALLTPLIRDYGKFIDAPETDTNSILIRLYQYMIDNSLRVKTRDITFDTTITAAGGNVGNGLVYRLTVDENGLDIENVHVEPKTIRCVEDITTGRTRHEELFVLRGIDRNADNLVVSGSGKTATLPAVSARNAQTYVRNPSFETYTGTLAVPTAIDGWTVSGSLTNLQINETNTYRDFSGITTARSLQFDADESVSQAFSVAAAAYSPFIPYHFQIAYNKDVGSVSGGTITIQMGAVTASADLASGTGWQILTLDLNEDRWFLNFNQTDPEYKITVSGIGAGSYVLVDDVIVTPMTKFDGTYFTIVGGPTRFLRDDEFTLTDTETGSKIQYWFWRAFGRYLPGGTGGAITWADPS